MQVTVTFRHMESSDALRAYATEKTARLEKYLFEPVEVHWVLSVEKIRHIADLTIVANKVSMKAEAKTSDMYSAIDGVIDKIERQVRRHKEKVKDHKPKAPQKASPAERAPSAGPRVVKKENQFIKPMSVEEAKMQLSYVDNPFLVFTDSETRAINVIYRLPDGDFGLIEAQVK
jgi:putative sigma-54 modulation protein